VNSFSIISEYYRSSNIANLIPNINTRYGTCTPFNNYLTNYYNNYVKPVVDNIGNTVSDSANNAKLAGRFSINVNTPL
jgi:hypothetical protein